MKCSTVLSLLFFATTLEAAESLYVAVGYGGRRMTSRDGQNWENVQQWAEKGADDSNNLMSIAYGKGKFVCVGGGGWSKETQAGHVLVSENGADWREVAKYPFRVNPVLFGGDRFVAGGPQRNLLWSADGEKWNDGPKIEIPAGLPGWAFWFRNGAVGNGRFVFMGNANKDQKTWWCVTTTNGEAIEHVSFEAPGSRGLAFGAGKFVAVNPDGVFTSADAKIWTPVSGLPTDEFRNIVWAGKGFLLTGKAAVYTSADGSTWTTGSKPGPGTVIHVDDHGFLATGWPGKMFFSADGKSWKQTAHPQPEMGINKVAVRPATP